MESTQHLEVIKQAILHLAGSCDGAYQQDGQGFNKFDSRIGRDLAEQIAGGRAFSATLAHKIASRYRGQLKRANIELPPIAVAEQIDAERKAAKAVAQQEARKNGVTIHERGSYLGLSFAYDPELVERARSLPGRRWDGASKEWIVPRSAVEEVLRAFPVVHLPPSWEEAKRAQEAQVQAEAAAKSAQVAEDLSRLDALLPTLERTPFEHQEAGARWLIERRHAILADDMGLGKTCTSLIAARALGHVIIVVAPAGLRQNWLREAEAVDASIEFYSWAKQPEPLDVPYTLIADESHYAQNLTSRRCKAFLKLAKVSAATFALTGTPIKNGRPQNLFPLLVATKHELGKDRRAYERRYCAAHATRWSKWDTTGSAHLDELHRLTLDAILRRTKDDCLDLPEKTRVLRKVEMGAEARDTYESVLHDLQAEYRRRKAAGEIKEADALVMLNHCRHASSAAKLEAATELSEEILEQGNQVVLFTAFKDSAATLASALNAGTITGDQSSQQRQDVIDAFQAGKLRSIVCTFGAGGVGITLTAAQDVILVDRPWTPGDAVQAEDRCHRIGAKSAVTAHWLQANGLDEAIDALLCSKQERAELILTGERNTLEGVGGIIDLADKVLG